MELIFSLPDPSKVPPEVAAQAWTNLEIALNSLQTKKVEYSNNNNGNDDDDEHVAKRIKTENGKTAATNKVKIKYELVDPFNLILHTIRRPDGEDDVTYEDMIEEAAKELKTTTGGKLTQLVVSGLVNAIAGVPTGLVQDRKWTVNPSLSGNTKQITTAANASMQQLKQIANSLHQTIQTRLENDVLVTTPIRIQEMLSPDLLPHEFKSIRKRIYETVILGKGIGRPTLEGEDLPTANSAGVHEVEKYKRCKSCGNNDQSSFVLDRKNGDVICSACGTVASEALMHEGSAYRKFEGEVDRNHHGDSANPLYSNAHNMSTTLGGISITTGAGLGGFGSQKKGLETVLRNAHAFTELNISQFGKGDRRTRIGYKDKQKKDAFMQMTHVGDALNLHEAVVQRAKELFAGFRDDRELVQQFKGVIAACLCEAFDQLSSDGRQILKQKEEAAPTETFVKSSRRNGLHHANLAGKGGLLLDFDAIQKKDKHGDNDGTVPQPAGVAQKPAPKWDLDDCRTWLLEASRSIAQRWIEDRKKGVKGIPTGTQDELEGSLVEHAITLCDLLEAELQQGSTRKGGASSTTNGRSSRAVVTPRAADMAKLGIKWQHSHERGSGGRGGIGNSGQRPLAAGAAQKGRTAGQILILKTAKKLGSMLKDEVVGTAIHKELRSLVGQQEAKKRQLMREEATRQRMAQMKRKSYLQLKALS
eukprot:scaffold618_cov130-Cylindrotheca_fusiformis.AAC.25